MGCLTELDLDAAERIALGHGLGACRAVVPIAAGTVNSNYFIDTMGGRFFVRVYEQQEVAGVAYEWALVDFLSAGGVPLPARVAGPEPGALRVGGKPVVVYRQVTGEDLCQRRVDGQRARTLGAALGVSARVGRGFPVVREGRFGLSDIRRLLQQTEAVGRPELAPAIARLLALHAELAADPPIGLPRGVVHGDLFRDNVLWQGDRLVALLDWESASDGVLVYDLAVAILAWCYGDGLDWTLARSLVDGYGTERALSVDEWAGLRWNLRAACLRFATTRICDVYLRGGYPPRYKDYRRFLSRLDAVEALDPVGLRLLLGGGPGL